MEHDDGLHDMWAALLANASVNRTVVVRLRYIALLREMSPDEAKLLNHLSIVQDTVQGLIAEEDMLMTRTSESHEEIDTKQERSKMIRAELLKIRNALIDDFQAIQDEGSRQKEFRFESCLAALQAAGLSYDGNLHFTDCQITPAGIEFLRACLPPKS
jgi:hypothetical protein